MGPQLYRCGNEYCGFFDTPWEATLQWGRNFIVAEIPVTPAPAEPKNMLQWGRNFIVAEIGRFGARPLRPPCFNGAATLSLRKYHPALHLPLQQKRASMGPQLYRCGNGHGSRRIWLRALRFNGAATLSLRKLILFTKYDPSMPLLQWGRNFIVAEIHIPQTGPMPALSCFNGAATLSLRKSSTALQPATPLHTLQWGRNFIVAEMSTTRTIQSTQTAASMGPQLYRCGNN